MCFPGPSHSHFSRRRFLVFLGAAGIASISGDAFGTATQATGEAGRKSAAPIKNRAPLAQNTFYTLPLGSIRPTGWLRDQLLIQANGLAGHLDETWPDVGPNSGWLGGTGESWERGPYYLDGLVPRAYLTGEAALIGKARKWMSWTIEHQSAEGEILRVSGTPSRRTQAEGMGDLPLAGRGSEHPLAVQPQRRRAAAGSRAQGAGAGPRLGSTVLGFRVSR